MTRFIDDAIEIINNFFPEEWENTYLFNSYPPLGSPLNSAAYNAWKSGIDTKIDEFSNALTNNKEQIFDKLNASILTGEYAGMADFENKLIKFNSVLDSISLPGTADTYVQSILNDKLKTNFIDAIKLALGLYLNLFYEVKLRYQADGISYVPIADFEARATYEDAVFDKHSSNLINFFYWNVRIAHYDHFLTPVEKDLLKLQEAEYVCRKSDASKFANLLVEKAKFLISKWVLRQEELTGEPVIAIAGGRTISLNTESLQSNLLPYWKDYIEAHYELGNRISKNKIKEHFEKTNRSVWIGKQKLKDLHCQIKYYKDVKQDYKSLNQIRVEIKKRWENAQKSTNISEKYNLSIAYLYAINNEFSFLLANQQNDLKKIRDLYAEIISVQNNTGLKNFFPQYKYLEYLVNQLRHIFNNRKALDSIKDSRTIIENCEKVFIDYKENIEWSEKNYNYVFVLPFEECFIPTLNQDIGEIYISSSFVLPLSKAKYKLEFEENRREYYTYKSSLEVFENLEKDVKDNQNRELRSMEIIGIFTAIVTFIATSIPTFQFIKSSYQAGAFMLALACSMGLFILMIIISSRGISKLKEHWLIILIIFIVAITSWFMLVNYTSDPKDKEFTISTSQKINRIDSIYKVKFDSINNQLTKTQELLSKHKHTSQPKP